MLPFVLTYINYKAKEQEYQKEISQILDLDLPAILPHSSTVEYVQDWLDLHTEDIKDLWGDFLEFCLMDWMLLWIKKML